jgi:hypothetical protein
MKHPLEIVQKPLVFDEAEHRYSDPENPHIKYTSVTQFISKLNPFDSDKIIQSIQTNPNSEWFGLTAEEIREKWRLSGELGTWFHNRIENWINQNPDPEVQEWVMASPVLQRLLGNRDLVHSEVRLRFDKLSLAGTSDLLIFDPSDMYWQVWDFKTSRKVNPDKIWTFSLQIQLYVWMLKSMGLSKVKPGGILWVQGVEYAKPARLSELTVEAIRPPYNGDILLELLKDRYHELKLNK